MGNTVEHINFKKNEVNHKVMLRKLIDDDNLKGCIVICMWPDDQMSVGWSDMDPSKAALGVLELQQAILKSAGMDND